jgi:hypothetical protein
MSLKVLFSKVDRRLDCVAPMQGQQNRQHWPSVAGAASVMDITYLLAFVSVIPN